MGCVQKDCLSGVDGRTCQAILLVLIPMYSKTWQGRTEKGTESNVSGLLSDQNDPQKLKEEDSCSESQ